MSVYFVIIEDISRLTSWTVGSISDCSEHTAHSEMTTTMDVRLIETRHVLNRSSKGRVIFLCKHICHQGWVRKSVHDSGVIVAPQTVSLRKIQHEIRWRERSCFHASTAGATSDI